MGNPFKEQFVTMKFPEGSGGVMAISGFNLEGDEHGCVDIPTKHVSEAESHGLYRADRPDDATKVTKKK